MPGDPQENRWRVRPDPILRLRTIRWNYGRESATPFGGNVRLAASRLAGMMVTVRPLLSFTADNTGMSEFFSKTSPVFEESEYPAGETSTAAVSPDAAAADDQMTLPRPNRQYSFRRGNFCPRPQKQKAPQSRSLGMRRP